MNNFSVSIRSASLFDKIPSNRTRYLKRVNMVSIEIAKFKRNFFVTYLSACSLWVPLKLVSATNCVRNVLAVIAIFQLLISNNFQWTTNQTNLRFCDNFLDVDFQSHSAGLITINLVDNSLSKDIWVLCCLMCRPLSFFKLKRKQHYTLLASSESKSYSFGPVVKIVFALPCSMVDWRFTTYWSVSVSCDSYLIFWLRTNR